MKKMLKNVGKFLEKNIIRPTLKNGKEFLINRAKEKSSMVSLVVSFGSAIGIVISPELGTAIVQAAYVASGIDTTVSIAQALGTVIATGVAGYLIPTSKQKK